MQLKTADTMNKMKMPMGDMSGMDHSNYGHVRMDISDMNHSRYGHIRNGYVGYGSAVWTYQEWTYRI
jgi:hypothetical protein